MNRDIDEEVGRLEPLDLDHLRREWRRRWGKPPSLRSTQLLRHLMAWRIQAAALGGIDQRTRLALQSATARPPPIALEVGLRLAREWKGVRYEVEVTPEGFRVGEQTFGSLSEAARAITGVRWNGFRFFGLRNSGA